MHNNFDFSFPGLPPDSKLHDLLSLASKDADIVPTAEALGSHLIMQHQKLMLDHFDHKHHTPSCQKM